MRFHSKIFKLEIKELKKQIENDGRSIAQKTEELDKMDSRISGHEQTTATFPLMPFHPVQDARLWHTTSHLLVYFLDIRPDSIDQLNRLITKYLSEYIKLSKPPKFV